MKNEPALVDRDPVAWNDEMVRRYDIERYYAESHPLVRWIEARRLRLLLRFARPAPGARLLEVGCGAGHVLQRFPGCARTGVDLSAEMLGRARGRLGPDVRLVRGSAEALPCASASFDIIICTEVLEHIPHPAAAIAELMRVAAPGARVVVSIPNEGNIDRAKQFITRLPLGRRLLRTLAGEDNEWHLHRFDAALLRDVAAGSARIRSIRGVPFPILPVRYVALLGPAGEP
jgi:ubiquinone/menaquinone biosynthesis C-methylase UbiE